MTLWIVLTVFLFGLLFYQRASLSVFALSFGLLLLGLTFLGQPHFFLATFFWILYLASFAVLLSLPLRRRWISEPLLRLYRKRMPSMSRTEREALAAGTVSWEGELFRGAPDWDHFSKLAKPELSEDEQAFIDGPVEQLCKMLDDWDITYNRADLSPEVWKFIRDEGFFGLIIPKAYGGKEFSAYAHSQILIKLYGRSTTAATTVSVPNSLGPAELLLHYGTEEQKNYYLPRLASGEEIPCFALTGPEAGSDAGAMSDHGIVTWSEFNGQQVLGICLQFNKRYITLAPVATVVGLAFKLYDPDHLLGEEENLGITCALIPRNTPNLEIGRRHLPANIPFQNGPVSGKDVFIPLDWIIGGPSMAGQGWRMLMECLSAGRAISLPASSCGNVKMLSYTTGAYARIRKQFKIPIGKFEGVAEVLARMAGFSYAIDAACAFATSAIDSGQKPAIASAIIKLHATELGRKVATDAMDIHGGKAICVGPNNYLASSYQSIPIAITVEGANILTRNMIIFGQGAMRCHPYIFAEFNAAQETNDEISLARFDHAIIGHMGYSISNVIRTLWLSITNGWLVAGVQGELKRYYQQVTRFSAAFAMLSDMSLLIFGGDLKRKENISARLGDLLSYLYLMSATLKHHENFNCPSEDQPLVEWVLQYYLFETQQTILDLLQNFPNRLAAGTFKLLIFPWGANFKKPSDKLSLRVADLLLSPTETRKRLTKGAWIAKEENNLLYKIEDALQKTIATEGLEKILQKAVNDNLITAKTYPEQLREAQAHNILSKLDLHLLEEAFIARQKIIAVDDFAANTLSRLINTQLFLNNAEEVSIVGEK